MGIACLRTSDYSVELSAFCDDQSYSKTLSVLTRHEPRTILFPPAMQDTVLAKIAMTEFPQASFSIVPRRAWNHATRACMRGVHARITGTLTFKKIRVIMIAGSWHSYLGK